MECARPLIIELPFQYCSCKTLTVDYFNLHMHFQDTQAVISYASSLTLNYWADPILGLLASKANLLRREANRYVCVRYVCVCVYVDVDMHKPTGILRPEKNIRCPLCLSLLYSLERKYLFEYGALPMGRKLKQFFCLYPKSAIVPGNHTWPRFAFCMGVC